MHTPYLTNEEDIEFPKVLSAKQCLGKSLGAKLIGRLSVEWSIVFHNPCPSLSPGKIVEVIAFATWLSAKQILPKSAV
jgi:hypothetical protein